jgi:hypothetical protein
VESEVEVLYGAARGRGCGLRGVVEVGRAVRAALGLWKGVAARQVVSGRPSCTARRSKMCYCSVGARGPVTHACGSGVVNVTGQLEADVCVVSDKIVVQQELGPLEVDLGTATAGGPQT